MCVDLKICEVMEPNRKIGRTTWHKCGDPATRWYVEIQTPISLGESAFGRCEYHNLENLVEDYKSVSYEDAIIWDVTNS
jgi:hypothetical protein